MAAGSNPKHTIYTFSICIIEIILRKGRKNEKEAEIGPLLKNGPFAASFFLYFRLFYKQLTVNKCSIKVADDRIRTRVLWYCKRPLCQLRHNHFPLLSFKNVLAVVVLSTFRFSAEWVELLTFQHLCNLRLVHLKSNWAGTSKKYNGVNGPIGDQLWMEQYTFTQIMWEFPTLMTSLMPSHDDMKMLNACV